MLLGVYQWPLLSLAALDYRNSRTFTPVRAQAQALLGEIDGNITDSTQAAIVGAKVVATNAKPTSAARRSPTPWAGILLLTCQMISKPA